MAHHNTPRTLADIEQGPGTLHDAYCDGETQLGAAAQRLHAVPRRSRSRRDGQPQVR